MGGGMTGPADVGPGCGVFERTDRGVVERGAGLVVEVLLALMMGDGTVIA